MSAGFAAVPNWIVREPEISLHEKIVYLVLSSHIGDQGTWFMSHSQIATMAGISVASVKRALAALRERGVVSWSGRVDPQTGAQLGNTYRLMTDRLGQGELPPSSEGATPPLSVSDQNKNPEEESIDTPPTPSEVEREFEALWSTWPKKAGKKAALTAWRRLSQTQRREIAPVLVAHAVAHGQHTPPQFIPMLSTWLNGERWNDELPVSRDRGAHRPEPPRPSGIHIPAGHVPVRDPETYQIIGSRPA